MAHITTALTNAEYHAADAISKSQLDLVSKSTALLEWSKNAPQEKNDTADIGNALHCALLEPERFADEYRKMPDFNLRTNAGKEQAEAFTNSSVGKQVLSATDYDLVIAMRDSTLAHPVARALLTEEGVSEASIFAEIDGVKVKCRPDRRNKKRKILVDVKSTADVDEFEYSVRDYRYDVQDAFYTDVNCQLTGEMWPFVFIAIDKKKTFGRHQVRVIELDQESKDEGRALYLADLERVKEMQAFGAGFEFEQIKTAKRWK